MRKEKRPGYGIAPATPEDVAWIAGLESSVYSREDAVPEAVLKEWYAANPDGFSVVKTSAGENIGHIDILPLRPEALAALLEGRIVEKDIPGSALFRPGERDRIRDLYVESLIMRPAGGGPSAAGLRLVEGFPCLIERICDASRVRMIYALAASAGGERLMKRLGFERFKEGLARADRHDIFAARFPALAERLASWRRPS